MKIIFVQEESIINIIDSNNKIFLKYSNNKNELIIESKNKEKLQLKETYDNLLNIRNNVYTEIFLLNEKEKILLTVEIISDIKYLIKYNNNYFYENLTLIIVDNNKININKEKQIINCDIKCHNLNKDELYCNKYRKSLLMYQEGLIFPTKGCYLNQKHKIKDINIKNNMEKLLKKQYE